MPIPLPTLRQILLPAVSSLPLPTLKIHTDVDVESWKSTQGYHDYALFLRVLNESVVGVSLPLDAKDVDLDGCEVCIYRVFLSSSLVDRMADCRHIMI